MAPTHSTVGGDEKDGREKICGVVSYQLHRDIEAVSCSGEIFNMSLIMIHDDCNVAFFI